MPRRIGFAIIVGLQLQPLCLDPAFFVEEKWTTTSAFFTGLPLESRTITIFRTAMESGGGLLCLLGHCSQQYKRDDH